jgi:outer membrane protein TolC
MRRRIYIRAIVVVPACAVLLLQTACAERSAGRGAASPHRVIDVDHRVPFPPARRRTVKLEPGIGLSRCIDLALENNRLRPASRMALRIAQAQHRQALAAYWPQISVSIAAMRMDESMNYIYPSNTMRVPAQNITIPAGAFGLGFPAADVNLAVAESDFEVPEQEITLMDRDVAIGNANLKYLLFDGGRRHALRRQTGAGIAAAREECRRADLQVVYDVRRMYYGVLLAKLVHKLGRDTLARMEVTLQLTERLYKKGSGKVKKTDYLRNKVAVEGIRSLVARLEANEKLARSALVNTMGLPWDTEVKLPDVEVPYRPYEAKLKELVSTAYVFSPDWAKMAAALDAARVGVVGARSGYFPRVAFTGNMQRIWNDYDKATMTDRNKNSWQIGFAAEMPLFDGFLTRNRVAEARARLAQLEHQKVLLSEGLALKVKHTFLTMMAAGKQRQGASAAMKAAVENRALTVRAYKQELLETKDVIEAQMTEAIVSAQYYGALYAHAEAQARLEMIVGREVRKVVVGR